MYIDCSDTVTFVEKCRSCLSHLDETLLICFARETVAEIDGILDALNAVQIRFFGGVFPALIEGTTIHENGAIVQPLMLIGRPTIGDISTASMSWTQKLPDVPVAGPKPTCLIMADFSCVAVSALLEELFDRHGNTVNYFGCGAGEGVREPSPVLFSNAGRHTGAAIVAYIATKAEVHLRHGWSRYSDPVIATKTRKNVIQELNWEPAMTVYRRLVGEQVADSLIRREDIPQAKRFPFGIAREDLEDVVRDPLLATENEELVVMSEVPEHSMLHILKADNDKLISAAEQLGAAFSASQPSRHCLLFDCFSRAKLLAEEFSEELTAFSTAIQTKQPGCQIEGALALGEIGSDGNRLPDFHNKTIAASLLYDQP